MNMTHTAKLKSQSLQQPLRRAALRRNLGTAAILAAAFSGGPFGLAWLAATSSVTLTALWTWRLRVLSTTKRINTLEKKATGVPSENT